jgi:hypothetical protein
MARCGRDVRDQTTKRPACSKTAANVVCVWARSFNVLPRAFVLRESTRRSGACAARMGCVCSSHADGPSEVLPPPKVPRGSEYSTHLHGCMRPMASVLSFSDLSFCQTRIYRKQPSRTLERHHGID